MFQRLVEMGGVSESPSTDFKSDEEELEEDYRPFGF